MNDKSAAAFKNPIDYSEPMVEYAFSRALFMLRRRNAEMASTFRREAYDLIMANEYDDAAKTNLLSRVVIALERVYRFEVDPDRVTGGKLIEEGWGKSYDAYLENFVDRRRAEGDPIPTSVGKFAVENADWLNSEMFPDAKLIRRVREDENAFPKA